MRIGVNSRGRWWVSMGLPVWLTFGVVWLAVLVAVGVGWVVFQLLRFLWLTVVELVSLVRHA